MPHSWGYRARTRHLFARGFGNHGIIPTQTFLRTYQIGQLVDLVGNGAVQKGMPHKQYHGRTGVVWNITPRAIGVEINKQVGNRIIPKRVHVRIEHVQPSECRKDFLSRVQTNEKVKKEAKAAGKTIVLKRVPVQPRKGGFVKKSTVENVEPLAYVGLYQ
jgi:large subunit ribosomal protein L21e